MVTDFGIGPHFERSHLSEMRAQLYGNQTLAGFSESDYSIQRRVQVQVAGCRNSISDFVVHTRERTIQAEGDWFISHQMQILAVEFQRLPFFCAARHQAHGIAFAHADVVGARKPATNQESRAGGLHIGVIGCAHRDRKIQIAILKHQRTPAIPALHNIRHAFAADFRNEESAVEENCIRLRIVVGTEKSREMPRHCWI